MRYDPYMGIYGSLGVKRLTSYAEEIIVIMNADFDARGQLHITYSAFVK